MVAVTATMPVAVGPLPLLLSLRLSLSVYPPQPPS